VRYVLLALFGATTLKPWQAPDRFAEAFGAAIVATTVAGVAAQAPLEFDVASLKRNTGEQSPFGSPWLLPSGEIRLIGVPLWLLVAHAYPGATVPVRREKMPSWGDETYDFIAKGKPNVTPNELAEMFRTLMAQRAKLAAHFETRPPPGYKLVFARADHRLGPSITPSTLDCSAPPSPQPTTLSRPAREQAARARCTFSTIDQTMITGGVTINQFLMSISGWIRQPIVDATGLTGFFALTFTFEHRQPRSDRPALPDDPLSVFTAIQEQLGLKLEPTTVGAQVLVIDHIERPAEN
jgi:uncharacterized protein (TIGR03435 family)